MDAARGGSRCSARCAGGGSVDAPGAGYALELVFASVGHGEARSDDEVLDGLGDEDLAGAGEGRDAGADVDGEPADVVADLFDLPGVKSGADREPRVARVGDLQCAPYGAGGTVEGREEAVAERLDRAASPAVDASTDEVLVSVEELRPCVVAHPGGAFRRVDDVGEHHRGQRAGGLGVVSVTGEQLLDGADERVAACARQR